MCSTTVFVLWDLWCEVNRLFYILVFIWLSDMLILLGLSVLVYCFCSLVFSFLCSLFVFLRSPLFSLPFVLSDSISVFFVSLCVSFWFLSFFSVLWSLPVYSLLSPLCLLPVLSSVRVLCSCFFFSVPCVCSFASVCVLFSVLCSPRFSLSRAPSGILLFVLLQFFLWSHSSFLSRSLSLSSASSPFLFTCCVHIYRQ